MPTAGEVRNAKAFLRGRTFNKSGEIQPKRFAAAAKETGSSFGDILKVIARSYAQGQGQDEQRQQDISSAAQSGN
jgi:hypothetical protein